MDHLNAAKEILAAVGGPENIVSAAHCATRLRLVIADDSKVNMAAVEDAEGAKGSFQAAGQLQVIYGTGTVNKVFDEFVKLAGITAGSTDDAKAAAAAKGNIFQRATKLLGDVFVPIIPAIVASGLLMGLTDGINNAMGGALSTNEWFIIISTFANASFIFLQILIGFSAARVFGGNEFLGGVIGMIMNHTGLINAWNIPGAVESFGDAAYQLVGANGTVGDIIASGHIPQVQLFGFYNVTLQGYQGHVIPVVVAVFIMCVIEKWLHKHVPDMFDLFVTPLVTVLVTGLLTMTIIGPVFSALEELVLNFFKFLVGIPFGLGGALAGGIYPFTVVLGVHHMFNAFEAGMCAGENPHDVLNPIICAANIAQGAACLAVFLKTKSDKKKGLALPSGISSLLGITEPAIYGVNLPALKPFIAAVCGAAAGGAVSSLLGLYSISYGITGFFGYLITSNALSYTIVFAVSFAVAFALCFFLYSDADADARKAAAQAAPAIEAAAVPEQVDAVAEPGVLASPMSGKAIALADVPDMVFASGAMGAGAAVEPTDGAVYSPVDGTVAMLFDTKHAIGLASDDGIEILIHIGIDTVELGGAPFTAHVAAGDTVKAGQLLIESDLAAIEAAGKSTTTMVIVTNTDDYAAVEPTLGDVAAGAKLVNVTK